MDTLSEQVIAALEDALEAYDELAQTLPLYLASDPDPAYDDDIARAFRHVGMLLSKTMAAANRTIDDLRLSQSLDDPRLVTLQPLLRMLGESFLLLALSRDRDEMRLAPLAHPEHIKTMSEHASIVSLRKLREESSRD